MVRKASPLRAAVQCKRCPRLTLEPRLGLCLGCYLRARRGTALPEHARCSTCHEDNPIVLVLVGARVYCLNCRALQRAAVA